MKKLHFCLLLIISLLCCTCYRKSNGFSGTKADNDALLSKYGFNRDNIKPSELYEKGYALFKTEKLRDAAVLFKTALDLDPSLAPAHYYSAVTDYLLYGEEQENIDIIFQHLNLAVAGESRWLDKLKNDSGLETLKDSRYYHYFVGIYKKADDFIEPPDILLYDQTSDKMREYYLPEKKENEENIHYINRPEDIKKLTDKKSFLLGTWYVIYTGSMNRQIETYYREGSYTGYLEKDYGGEMNLDQFIPFEKYGGNWDFDAENMEIHYSYNNGGEGRSRITDINSVSVSIVVDDNPVQLVRKYTPLHYAALFGDLEKIKLLVEEQVDINLKNCRKQSPLFLSLFNGQDAAADYLISQGARIADYDLLFNIITAEDSKSPAMLDYLIRNGLKPDTPITDNSGRSSTACEVLSANSSGKVKKEYIEKFRQNVDN